METCRKANEMSTSFFDNIIYCDYKQANSLINSEVIF